mmetsp:Transcript_26412/g.30539  ORF Transcript_26412/g.30539 Transcript_26412/m.30539 type:complete len:85 (+) Transcript_26412:2582-2836(+)
MYFEEERDPLMSIISQSLKKNGILREKVSIVCSKLDKYINEKKRVLENDVQVNDQFTPANYKDLKVKWEKKYKKFIDQQSENND